MKRIINKKLTSNNQGFTILELLIATAISSGAILLLMFGFLAMSNTYTKGLTVTETQNTARDILNTVSQAIQFGDQSTITGNIQPVSKSTSGWFCADNSIFVYTLGQTVASNPTTNSGHALIEQTGACPSGTFTADNPPYNTPEHELLGPNMELAGFNVIAGADNTYQIDVHVIYGNTALLEGVAQPNGGPNLYYDVGSSLVKCNGQAGQDFCASSDLQTVVEPRIAN